MFHVYWDTYLYWADTYREATSTFEQRQKISQVEKNTDGGTGRCPALVISSLSTCLLLLLLLYCTRVPATLSAALIWSPRVVILMLLLLVVYVNLIGAPITQVHYAGMMSQPKCRH